MNASPELAPQDQDIEEFSNENAMEHPYADINNSNEDPLEQAENDMATKPGMKPETDDLEQI